MNASSINFIYNSNGQYDQQQSLTTITVVIDAELEVQQVLLIFQIDFSDLMTELVGDVNLPGGSQVVVDVVRG